MNANRPAIRYALAGAVLLAGVAWSLSWAFNAQASAGDIRSAFGLDEAQWRATLNPAIAAVLAALVVWLSRDPHPAKMLLVAGVAALLAGNVLEHGPVGQWTSVNGAGPAVFVTGAVAIIAACGWLIGHGGQRLSGRRWVGIGSGVGSTLVVTTMALAAPAAASLGLVLLVDALLQAHPESLTVAGRTSAPAIAPRGMLAEGV